MRRCLLDKYSSSKESEYVDLKTDKASYSTDLTNVDTGSNDNSNNRVWLLANKDYPPKYYLK